jgi:hypothetical protein
MTQVRVMAIFQGGSLLPEDRFINTFHFADEELTDSYLTLAEGCRERVRDFYVVAHTTDPLGLYLSSYVQRAFTVVSYNMLLPKGTRTPTVLSGTLPNVSGGGLPEEVAICLTLQGAPPVTARRRGRLYIGPLMNQSTVIAASSSTTPARPLMTGASNVAACILDKANFLVDESSVLLPWCIRSTVPTENYVPIVQGYVDNAFDTQRRRGPDPSTRNYFTL